MKIVSPYKHVYFRIHQHIYQWGTGWVVSDHAREEWEREVLQLISLLGLKEYRAKITGASPQGVNETGESIYMHPMDFTGIIHEDNINQFTTVINAFKSQYWSYAQTDIYELNTERNQYANVFDVDRNKERYKEVTTG